MWFSAQIMLNEELDSFKAVLNDLHLIRSNIKKLNILTTNK